jgi:hypothetical protein
VAGLAQAAADEEHHVVQVVVVLEGVLDRTVCGMMSVSSSEDIENRGRGWELFKHRSKPGGFLQAARVEGGSLR